MTITRQSPLKTEEKSNSALKISANIVDVLNSKIFPGTLEVRNGRITSIVEDTTEYPTFILPGFVDSHIHIESSLLTPSEFARMAVRHGTVATVSDPHEIGNVLGVEGVRYMIENGRTVPFKFYFGAPSCVPATRFETSGAEIGLPEIEGLFKNNEAKFLSEVMDFTGVLRGDPEVTDKIRLAHAYGRRVDGHAPGPRGAALKAYAAAGISTDHEVVSREEALERIGLGMKIQIREGSAAKNFHTLQSLITEYPGRCMLCSDDKHADDLSQGHIDALVKRALSSGLDLMKVLISACVTPVLHYGLDVGLLREGDDADFIEINNFGDLRILRTYIKGDLVAENGSTLLPWRPSLVVSGFKAQKKKTIDLSVRRIGNRMNVIEVFDGQLVTERRHATPKTSDGNVISDVENDLLKIVVVNRYRDAPPAVAFVKNFGLKRGAIASSIAHDSHNIVAVGVSDEDICQAVNAVIEQQGGLSVVHNDVVEVLPLPVAGIMTDDEGPTVAERYSRLNRLVKNIGSRLSSPLMTLSFMALLVIPKIKLSDKGLFDAEKSEIIGLFE